MKSYLVSSCVITLLCSGSVFGMQTSFLSSKDLIEKFNTLVALTKDKPRGTEEALYQQVFGNMHYFDNMFNQATRTGLVQQYQQILLGDNPNIYNGQHMFLMLCRPDVLRWIAYLQNLFGKGQPFEYDSTVTALTGAKHPSIGIYQSAKSKLNITSYGLLRGLMDAVDATNTYVKTVPWQRTQTYRNHMQQLDNGLQQAIVTQREANENPLPVIERPKKNSAESFDDAVNELKKLVQQGKTHIVSELEALVARYRR